MKGYFRMPDETAAVLKNGWFHTGDLGVVDDDGFYRIVGRKKDVIISAGLNIYPEDVSGILRSTPGIVDAATFGVPDESWGERAVSCVIASKDAQLTEEQIASHFLAMASPEKLPREIYFLDEFPRGPAGKVIIADLRNIVADLRKSEKPTLDSNGSVRERVLRTAASSFKVPIEDLSLESSSEDTEGWTSLAHVEFLLALEKDFNIHLSPRDIMSIRSIGNALTLIQRHLAVTD
jgi:long-chain acyl-CoA synthetase